MARITGSLLISARGGSGSGNAWDAPAAEGAAENAERGTRKGEQARPALARPFRVPTSALRVSQNSIHQRAQEHDDADNATGGEEGGIEPRQVSGFHEVVLPGNQQRPDGNAGVAGEPELRPVREARGVAVS